MVFLNFILAYPVSVRLPHGKINLLYLHKSISVIERHRENIYRIVFVNSVNNNQPNNTLLGRKRET